MPTTSAFAEIAALAGDPARAAMLHALMDGRALTATELASVAGVTPQTASGHLGSLARARLLVVERQGRHHYHRIADPDVARMIEGIMAVAASRVPEQKPIRVGPRDRALRAARTCYDHLAGRLGVALADALVDAGYAEIEPDGAMVTESGTAFLTGLGIMLPAARRGGRVFCQPCLDWSERRPHLAGAVGACLCAHCLEAGWIKRVEHSRALTITAAGEKALHRYFGVRL